MAEIYLVHPIFVHFTIGLLSASLLAEILLIVTKKEVFREVAKWNLVFAIVAVISTVITGLIAEDFAPNASAAGAIIESHETIGFVALGLILILFIIRFIKRESLYQKHSQIFLILFIASLLVTFLGGYYGGKLVFEYGVGVTAVQSGGQSSNR